MIVKPSQRCTCCETSMGYISIHGFNGYGVGKGPDMFLCRSCALRLKSIVIADMMELATGYREGRMVATPRKGADFVGWRVSSSKPYSLDYINPALGYQGDSVTGTAFWIYLDEVRSVAGLQGWLNQLIQKKDCWFDPVDFLTVRNHAVESIPKRKAKRT
jgi:hypothetical protein